MDSWKLRVSLLRSPQKVAGRTAIGLDTDCKNGQYANYDMQTAPVSFATNLFDAVNLGDITPFYFINIQLAVTV